MKFVKVYREVENKNEGFRVYEDGWVNVDYITRIQESRYSDYYWVFIKEHRIDDDFMRLIDKQTLEELTK